MFTIPYPCLLNLIYVSWGPNTTRCSLSLWPLASSWAFFILSCITDPLWLEHLPFPNLHDPHPETSAADDVSEEQSVCLYLWNLWLPGKWVSNCSQQEVGTSLFVQVLSCSLVRLYITMPQRVMQTIWSIWDKGVLAQNGQWRFWARPLEEWKKIPPIL